MDSVNTAAILEFWFGAAAESPAEVRTAKKYWYRSGPRLDKEIIQRFLMITSRLNALIQKMSKGTREISWHVFFYSINFRGIFIAGRQRPMHSILWLRILHSVCTGRALIYRARP